MGFGAESGMFGLVQTGNILIAAPIYALCISSLNNEKNEKTVKTGSEEISQEIFSQIKSGSFNTWYCNLQVPYFNTYKLLQ